MVATSAVGGTSTGGVRAAARAPGRLGSEEYHSTTLPCAQDAALLYSANFPDAAARLLKTEIKDPVGRSNTQAWLMLFDIYQLAQNREEFDALSMLFTVKFEQSPPVWVEIESPGDPKRSQSRERKDLFSLKPAAGGGLATEIDKFHAFAEAQGSVRLDVAKVGAITAEEAALLAKALQRLRKKATPMWFSNVEVLEQLLRAAFNEKATEAQRPYWGLLFELYILEGKMHEFEELGMEYAVAFEMSPPSWEVYVNAVAVAVKTSVAKAVAAANPAENGFPLKGMLSVASANQIAELNTYAAGRTEVAVDMSKVLRIDFGYTGSFFDMIKTLQLAGKRVILANLNELNAALLEALGVNRYAILVRRKST